jgi:hypothetical protein
LRKAGDVWLNEIFSLLDLVKIFLRTDWLGRMSNITRTRIPIE